MSSITVFTLGPAKRQLPNYNSPTDLLLPSNSLPKMCIAYLVSSSSGKVVKCIPLSMLRESRHVYFFQMKQMLRDNLQTITSTCIHSHVILCFTYYCNMNNSTLYLHLQLQKNEKQSSLLEQLQLHQ